MNKLKELNTRYFLAGNYLIDLPSNFNHELKFDENEIQKKTKNAKAASVYGINSALTFESRSRKHASVAPTPLMLILSAHKPCLREASCVVQD